MARWGGKKEGNRAYILLNVSYGKLECVARALRPMAGVVFIDVLEGPPDLILILEANKRQELAQLTVQALAAVEPLTENIQMIPAKAMQ